MASLLSCRRLPPHLLSAPPLGAGRVAERASPGLEGLLARARDGDRDAFMSLCDLHADGLERYLTSYLRGDAEAARDILQDTFLVAWGKVERIKNPGHMRPWLYRIARYKAIDHLRRRGPGGTPMASLDLSAARGHEIPDPGGDPLRRAMVREPDNPWLPALRRAIARLPARHVAVVRLHYLRGLTTREVGRLLQMNQTTVKMRLLRAREMLRKLVVEEMRGGPGRGD